MQRDQQLTHLRSSIKMDYTSPDEQLQNLTLNTILNLQHDLIIAVFENYLEEKFIRLSSMTPFKQRITIENAVKKDLPLRYTLIGCVIGHFTLDEYNIYLSNRLFYCKQLTSLLIDLLTDHFIKPHSLQQ